MKAFVVATVVWWVVLGGMALWAVAGEYPERQILAAAVLIKGLGAPIFSFVEPGSIPDFLEYIGFRSALAYLLLFIGVLWIVYIVVPSGIVSVYRAYQARHRAATTPSR